MVVVTVDPVVHLFVAVFTLAGAVRRRRSYAGHSSGQGWRPGLTCGTGDVHVIKTGRLIIKKTSMAHARVHRVHFHSHGKPFWKALCNRKIVNLLEKRKGKEYNGCVFRSGENGNVSINHNKTNALFVPKRCSKTNYWHVVNPKKHVN